MKNANQNQNKYCIFFIFSVAFLVYIPGLPGGFIYDDYFNILENATVYNSSLGFSDAWSAMWSGTSGPTGRPLAMLSFYLNAQLSDFSPLSFKLFNILIHAINSILVFFIVCHFIRIINRDNYIIERDRDTIYLAMWIALVWAVHPLNLTAVLYVVQRMTSLSALFTLLGILYYIKLRISTSPQSKEVIVRLACIFLLGVFAALCKENGLLLFLFLFLIESIIFKWRGDWKKEIKYLNLFYLFFLFLPLLVVLYLFVIGDLTGNFSNRTFSLTERLLTQARVIWFYILQIALPQATLFGLHHDDFVISKSIIQPITTLISILALIILGFLTVKIHKKYTWFSFGFAFFIAGHIMESTVLPLNMVHEHRNYLPSIGILFIVVITINNLLKRITLFSLNKFMFIFLILFSSMTISRAHDWSNVVLLGERLAQRHPNSINANYEMGYVYSKLYQYTLDRSYAERSKVALSKAEQLSESDMKPTIALLHIKGMLKEDVDQALINKVRKDFESNKVTVFEVISLRQLANCHTTRICNFNSKDMRVLFNSLLANHHVKGRLRDDILYHYSHYLDTIYSGSEEALAYMNEITSRNPDVLEYKVKLVSMLMANGKINEAEFLMDELTKKYGYKWNVVKK